MDFNSSHGHGIRKLHLAVCLCVIFGVSVLWAKHRPAPICEYHANMPSIRPAEVAAIFMVCEGGCPPSNDAGMQVCCGVTFQVTDNAHIVGSFYGSEEVREKRWPSVAMPTRVVFPDAAFTRMIEVMPDREYVIKTSHRIGGSTCAGVTQTISGGREISTCNSYRPGPWSDREWRTVETDSLRANHVYQITCSSLACEYRELSGSYEDYLRKHDAFGRVRH